MDSNKKAFNYTALFVVVYILLAVIVVIWIWWPKGVKESSATQKYHEVDANKKATDMYTIKLKKLLSKGDMEELFNRLDAAYIQKYNLNKDNFQKFLEDNGYISDKINIISFSINIQDNDVYVYKYLYSNGSKRVYVNVVEPFPYQYTLSFEQDVLPNVAKDSELNNSNSGESNFVSDKVTIIDNIKYSVSKKTIREDGITYTLKITNNSENEVKYKFDNITNVSVVLSNGTEAYLGGVAIYPEDDIITPNGYLEKDLFFAVSGEDQNKIKYIKIKNVRIGDSKKNININV